MLKVHQMKTCPNCKKELNERFEYCRICGSKLNGESVGDFSTEIKNLFKKDEDIYYLFATNGNQVIVRGKTIEEIKNKVLRRNFPWIENKNYQMSEDNNKNYKMSGDNDRNPIFEEDFKLESKSKETDNYFKENQTDEMENKEIRDEDYELIQTKHIKLNNELKEEKKETKETNAREEKNKTKETNAREEKNKTKETNTRKEEKETIIPKSKTNKKTPIKRVKEEPM